ncbi:serine hydrolase domain-containing protein [Streptomyces sp. B1866]|uniref:serine hydrolase domain-containing protein n=1 Tax=Streptomyces sp. B1866 TaxID=3075431 RepID=UPI00288DAB7F|nr:serine hydrolase domain-containing protein [Streptomyces sp. B1866]MDT3398730.1 serine hydrolase domain-containing protein [Streptomyces sp. B1866]
MRPAVAAALAAAALACGLTGPVSAAGPVRAASPGGPALQRDTDAVVRAGTYGAAVELTTPEGTATAHGGVADRRTGRPMRPWDRYRAGSTVKTLVAAVTLQLVAEGRLSLDGTVDRWLPGAVHGNGNDGRRITLRHLLQHTSGLRGYTGVREVFPVGYSARGYFAHRFDHHTPEEFVAAATRYPPRFAPGTDWAYSNTNYVLVGMIIEKAAGRTWRDEVRDRLIGPLGLRETSLPADSPVLPAPFAHGYQTFAEDGLEADTTLFNGTGADAAGDLVTTPHDVNRFFTALLGGRVLRPAQLAEMLRPRPLPGEPGRGYGLGIETTPLSCGGLAWHHGGNALGYSSENAVSPDGRRAVTVSTNTFDEADEERQERTDAAVRALIDHAMCG